MIEFENLTKIYRLGGQEIHAVDGVSLTIETGEFVALRGPSGSGKSTAMHIMGCLDRPDSGKYFLKGREVGGLAANEQARIRNLEIGFVHQNFHLLPRLTALENVELPLVYASVSRQQRLEKARYCLKAVGLSDREGHLPGQLSGGQQQRVAIARALVNNPDLLLADEPTGNLDSKVSVEIMGILSRLHQRGTTVVLVTHEQDIADWAERAIYFRDGRLGS